MHSGPVAAQLQCAHVSTTTQNPQSLIQLGTAPIPFSVPKAWGRLEFKPPAAAWAQPGHPHISWVCPLDGICWWRICTQPGGQKSSPPSSSSILALKETSMGQDVAEEGQGHPGWIPPHPAATYRLQAEGSPLSLLPHPRHWGWQPTPGLWWSELPRTSEFHAGRHSGSWLGTPGSPMG